MTNVTMLEQIINDSGIKRNFIAEKLGITYQSLLKKLKNESEFTASEIRKLKDLLGLSIEQVNAIFFAS